jgi:hypothetical protein
MAAFRASVKVLPTSPDQTPGRISHLHELSAYLNNEPAARQLHDSAVDSNSEEPPRKRQRLSEPPLLSFDTVEKQGLVVLASIDVRLVSIHVVL